VENDGPSKTGVEFAGLENDGLANFHIFTPAISSVIFQSCKFSYPVIGLKMLLA